MKKKLRFRDAPPHIRGAIGAAATRWETPDGTPLTALLPPPPATPPNPLPNPEPQGRP